MHFFGLLTTLMLAVLSAAAPRDYPAGHNTPISSRDVDQDNTPVSYRDHTSREEHVPACHGDGCVWVTLDYRDQFWLPNTSCYNFRSGTVTGLLVANCRCYTYE